MLRCRYVFTVVLLANLIAGNYPVTATEFPAAVLESSVSVLPHRNTMPSDAANGSGRPEEPEGSGIAVFDGRHIATAAHVLVGTDQVSVRLHDGRVIPAEILGRDRLTDIALLKISIALSPFSLSETAHIGDDVCTIGNQFGLGLSVTCGVISAVHRSNAGFNPIEDFIQTDAVVNPGASGGALVDEQGNLVGMLSGIFTKDSDANIGVNFAVHTKLLERVLMDLKEHGRVWRAKSGMVVRSLEMPEMQTQTGVRVMRITSGGAADRAGLRPDDVIVTMQDRKILYPGQVSAVVYTHRPGETIIMDVMREGQRLRIDLILD